MERFHYLTLGVSQNGGPRDDDDRRRRRFRMKRDDCRLVTGSGRQVLEMNESSCESCISDRLCRRESCAEELMAWLVAIDFDISETAVPNWSSLLCMACCSEPCFASSFWISVWNACCLEMRCCCSKCISRSSAWLLVKARSVTLRDR